MIIFKKPSDFTGFLLGKKSLGIITGFVPTMGALHQGHASLLEAAQAESELVICSIFVNPTQFNDPKDFERYPSTIEKDIYLLEQSGCDVLFLPSVHDMYPTGLKPTRHYDIGELETLLEGQYRPDHFQGVCQVVHRLLKIVMPSKLFLGQKDFQQCMIIKKMIGITKTETEVIVCATLREADGLAMSSRNMRLNERERQQAPALYKVLTNIKNKLTTDDLADLKREGVQFLNEKGFKVDYLEVADPETLQPVALWHKDTAVVILTAAYLNEIRLIDSIVAPAIVD